MTDEHSVIDDATIAAYLDGDLSPDEAARVERAVAKDARFAEELDGMRELLTMSIRYPRWDGKQLWNAFAEDTGLGTEAKGALQGSLRRARQHERAYAGQTLRRWAWPMLAAMVAGIVVIVASWNAGVSHRSSREAVSMSTYTTGNGQRATITLPDGSTVVLNVASRLEVPTDYAAGHRVVQLVGEGLFTVLPHSGTPFTVIAGSVTARVLGTSFVVRHYPADTTATVVVREGKVAVRSMVLTAARQLVVSRTGMMRVGQADPSQFSFVTGVLSFDGVPLRDAIVVLDRWFDADVRLGDTALGARQVSGGFTAGSLSDLTESLELMFNARVVRDGRVLTVYPR